MVAEGTVVAEGEYVARLDRSELDAKIKDAQTEIEKIETQLQQAKIDTAIEMREIRDQLINLDFSKKQKLLEVEQSAFEAPMVIQQVKIDLQRAERDFKQLENKYSLTKDKSEAKISEINASLKQNEAKLSRFSALAKEMTVLAPKDGMVIYHRTWNGKVTTGSQVSAWNPIVAELPDLTDMVSKSFVNEVDISRVSKGQEVKLLVDAFPDNEYTGKVIKVANIGEQLKNYDAKVFEVVVQVNESDSILRPAMTTGNEIITDIFPNLLSVPLEALQTDSLTYVFVEEGKSIVKKEVITGLSNNNRVIIEHGLEEGAVYLLSIPDNPDDLKFVPLDQKIKDDILAKQEAALAARKQAQLERSKAVKDEEISTGESGGGNIIIFN